MIVLTLQAGRGWLAYDLWDMAGERLLVEGRLESIRGKDTFHRYAYRHGSGRGHSEGKDHADALVRALEVLRMARPPIERLEGLPAVIDAVGHLFPCRPAGAGSTAVLSLDLLEAIEGCPADAIGDPSCFNASLVTARKAIDLLPDAVHAAIFDDVAFQSTTNEALCYPVRVPRVGGALVQRLRNGGIRIRSVLDRAMDILGPLDGALLRTVVCDLDTIPQVTSLKGQTVVDSTLQLDGSSRLPSETESGCVPPGLRAVIARLHPLGEGAADALLQERSGLWCIEDQPLRLVDIAQRASEGIYGPGSRMLLDQIVREIGGQVALLGGIDCLVFSGSIGVASPALRSMLAARLRLFRIALDEKRNDVVRGTAELTGEGCRVRVLVVPSTPARQIALETARILDDGR